MKEGTETQKDFLLHRFIGHLVQEKEKAKKEEKERIVSYLQT